MSDPTPLPRDAGDRVGPRAPDTHFIELGGEAAASVLDALARALPHGVTGELLVSRDQADLHLLVCRGDGDALTAVATPEGARRWRFAAATPPAPTP